MSFMPFYEIVEFLYHSVMDRMPQAFQDRDIAAAFTLGAAGTYAVSRGIQRLAKNLSWFPLIEKAAVAAAVACPVIYAMIDPEGARDVIKNHETYTSGMAGVAVGGAIAVIQDLANRRALEEIIN